jgi:hypothetical protein
MNLLLSPGNTGASWRKPTPARSRTLARVVTSMTKRSGEVIARRRRAARMRRIDGYCGAAKVLENPIDDGWCLNAGDDMQVPAVLPAGRNINSEHPPEALCPSHCPLPVAERFLATFSGSGGVSAGHNPGPVGARRREHAVLPGQVRARFWSAGVTPDMIRLCVGIEHIDDILADFDQALAAAK